MVGALLFGAHAWLGSGEDEPARGVRITTAEVRWLEETWARQWQRPPGEQELRGLVSDYLRESLLAREARALGLDENDTIVRRRLAQKMEFLVQDTARLAEPGEDALRRFYQARRASYRTPARVSFTQLVFKTEAAARRALKALETQGPADLGEPTLLARDYLLADKQQVASVFGPAFADTCFALAPGPWHGPVASGYGFHLVQVEERQDGQVPPFEQVRARVLDEWHGEQQAKASERFFDLLLDKYDVVVEGGLEPGIGTSSRGTQRGSCSLSASSSSACRHTRTSCALRISRCMKRRMARFVCCGRRPCAATCGSC